MVAQASRPIAIGIAVRRGGNGRGRRDHSKSATRDCGRKKLLLHAFLLSNEVAPGSLPAHPHSNATPVGKRAVSSMANAHPLQIRVNGLLTISAGNVPNWDRS